MYLWPGIRNQSSSGKANHTQPTHGAQTYCTRTCYCLCKLNQEKHSPKPAALTARLGFPDGLHASFCDRIHTPNMQNAIKKVYFFILVSANAPDWDLFEATSLWRHENVISVGATTVTWTHGWHKYSSRCEPANQISKPVKTAYNPTFLVQNTSIKYCNMTGRDL